jgi:molybdopterin synthase catalytic subunit/molybdopterin synthase sulfur carrier subunit
MPRVRLFGPVADAAGTKSDFLDGTSIEEVLNEAKLRYGPRFVERLQVCRIWVNGEMPLPDVPLHENDELAVLPPVSGG